MIGKIKQWWASTAPVGEVARKLGAREIEQLEWRILSLLADLWHRQRRNSRSTQEIVEDMSVNTTRLLVSGDEVLEVTGTEAEIEAAAHRMSRRTKACVTVAVIVSHYHRRGCVERKAGGYDRVGN